ncbi:Uncharacterised protein [uncultured archaeon]|nr:Uncharacterised protein [uncultured archaeon]
MKDLNKRIGSIKFNQDIDVQSGDCANFAEALRNLVGGTIVCVFANEGYEENEEPTHCALKIGSELYDGSGKITEQQLLARAKLQDIDAKGYLREMQYVDGFGYRGIRDQKKIRRIQKVLSAVV